MRTNSICVEISERSTTPKAFSFGWQRGQLLGGFFNGVFLLALGISIFLQSIERLIDLRRGYSSCPKISGCKKRGRLI